MPKPFEVGKTYKMRAGGEARVIALDRRCAPNDGRTLVALRECSDGRNNYEFVQVYWPDGRLHSDEDNSADLIPEREVIVRWVNVFRGKAGTLHTFFTYESEKAADYNGSWPAGERIGPARRIEIEV